MLPSIFGENLFDELFDFPTLRELRNIDRKLYGRNASNEMKTDVKEHEDRYEVDIDLPGFKKDEIQLSLENGYLTVTAAKGVEKDEEKKGKLIRQERWAGTLQRSFWVGEVLEETDIGAKFENGVLSLNIPKKEEKKTPSVIKWICYKPHHNKGVFHEQDNTRSKEKARGSFMGNAAREKRRRTKVRGKSVKHQKMEQEIRRYMAIIKGEVAPSEAMSKTA